MARAVGSGKSGARQDGLMAEAVSGAIAFLFVLVALVLVWLGLELGGALLVLEPPQAVNNVNPVISRTWRFIARVSFVVCLRGRDGLYTTDPGRRQRR